MIANFELLKWLYFDATVRFFAVDLGEIPFGAGIYNISTSLVFKPINWLGLSLSYELFDVNVEAEFDVDDI